MGLSRSTLSSTSCKRLMPTSSLSTLWVEAALSHSVNGYIYNYIYTLGSPEVPLLDSLCTPSSTSTQWGPLCPRQHAFLRLLPLLWQAALWQRWAWLLQHLCYPCNGKLHSGNGEHGFFSPTLTTCVFLSIITGQGRSYSCNSLLALADNNYFRKLNVKYCSSIVSNNKWF